MENIWKIPIENLKLLKKHKHTKTTTKTKPQTGYRFQGWNDFLWNIACVIGIAE